MCWRCSSSASRAASCGAILCWAGPHLGLALTLAGITGIIVSIGVSVDSNVVYYEHLKEDVRAGRTIRASVDKSFASAWSTILAADFASIIGAGLLYYLTIGAVRGFAFFLGLSTILDLITSWCYMRPAVAIATRSKMCQEHPHRFGLPTTEDVAEAAVASQQLVTRGGEPMSVVTRLYRGETNIDFPKWWKRALVFSGILIFISVLSLFTRGLNLGIDFEGGVSWEVKAPGVSVEHARSELGVIVGSGTKIQTVGDSILVEAPKASDAKLNQVRDILAKLGKTDAEPGQREHGGPVVGQGHHPQGGAGAGRLPARPVALPQPPARVADGGRRDRRHGPRRPHQRRRVLGLPVRGDARRRSSRSSPSSASRSTTRSSCSTRCRRTQARRSIVSRLTYTDMVNLSMNQVLMRSINTTVWPLLPVLSLLVVGAGILGAVALEEFALALLVGLIAGAYSSIFVAAPILACAEGARAPQPCDPPAGRVGSRRPRPTLAEAEIDTDDEVRSPVRRSTSTRAGRPRRPWASSAIADRGTRQSTQIPAAPASAIPPRPRKKGKRR